MLPVHPFYCIRFSDHSQDAELIADRLSELELPAGTWHDLENGGCCHTLYYTESEERDEAFPGIAELLNSWRAEGALLSEPEIFDLPAEDWAESWKRFFNIQHLTPTLVVKPTWLEYTPTPDQTVIEIDPGMSFGTGRHATTVFCLKQIEALSKILPPESSLLDAGTGSGILAIGAAKYGFSPIDAFDYDPVCIPCSEENAEVNLLPPNRIRFFQADLTQYPVDKTYDVVIANILAPVLLGEVERLIRLTQAGGYLILAGILTTEYPKIREAFTAAGLSELTTETAAEWTGGLFQKSK